MERGLGLHGAGADASAGEGLVTLAEDERASAVDPRWFKVVRSWGIIVALASVVATVLWAVDWAGWLGVAPEYKETASGQLIDEAAYYVGSFARDGQLVWYFRARDAFIVLYFLGLIPLMLAVNALVGPQRARVQVATGFFGAAAVFGVFIALPRVAMSGYWGDWGKVPAEITVTMGRVSAGFHNLSWMSGLAADLALAIGLGYLAAACRSEERLPRWLVPVAWVGTATLAADIVIASVPVNMGPSTGIVGILWGVVVLPLVALGLGLHLGRGPGQRSALVRPAEPTPSVQA